MSIEEPFFNTGVGRGDLYGNRLGDSFLHRCFANIPLMDKLTGHYTPLLGWSEPYPMLLLTLVLLLVLPTIFRIGQFQKASRLYHVTRLSLLSLFHQICYSYTLIEPISMLLRQSGPCFYDGMPESLDYALPSELIASAFFFLFTVTKFGGLSPLISIIVWTLSSVVICTLAIAAEFTSIFQAIVTICIVYIVHTWHQFLPFKFIHVENVLLFFLNTGVFISYLIEQEKINDLFYEMWFSLLLPLIDEVMFIRHHISRENFSMIERPRDLIWTTESVHVESVRLLNSEEEETFARNIREDLMTSIISFITFFAGVLIRVFINANFFA